MNCQRITSAIACINALTGVFVNISASAQVTPDASLGVERSLLTPNVQIQGITADRIDGGAIRGSNLFHSFSQFNIDNGQRVYFANPTGIENIFSRVTGSQVSNILGTLGVAGNANLFLINPNGIIFGQNTRLDVNASFLASTASSINFADGNQFSAIALQTPPLLTVNTPVGLQFGKNPGEIRLQGQSGRGNSLQGLGLIVPEQKTLSLVGSHIFLEGAYLNAPGGRIQLGSVVEDSLVQLHPTNQGWNLSYQPVQNFGNIKITRSFVDVGITENSNIQEPREDSAITINAAQLDVAGSSIIRASNFTSVPGADVNIDVERLIMKEGVNISSQTFSTGKAGNININASEAVEVIGSILQGQFPTILSTVTNGMGNAGALTINTAKLIIQDGAQVLSTTRSTGEGGELTITALKLVQVTGTAVNGNLSFLSSQTSAQGNAGSLTITTPVLQILDGAQVSSGTMGTGEGGNLTINAGELVQIQRGTSSNRFSTGLFAATLVSGDAGSIKITTPVLQILDGGIVSASTSGKGKGGSLTVNASESIQLIGTSANGQVPSSLSVQANRTATAEAGSLTITTPVLLVRDGGQIISSTFGTNKAGSLTIKATESVQLIGTSANGQIPSGLFARSEGRGNGGDLRIDTPMLMISNQAQATVSSTGEGIAGNIDITADKVRLNNGKVIAQANSTDGGNILLDIKDLILLRRNSEISATAGTASAGGDGGNISIKAPFIVAVSKENSDITANAFLGQGGNININTQGIFGLQFREAVTDFSDITASSELGVNGVVEINNPDIDPSQGLVELPTQLVDVSRLINENLCVAANEGSAFIVTGRGGLPASPYEILNPEVGWEDWSIVESTISLPKTPISSHPVDKPQHRTAKIVEAQGMVKTADGTVILTANPVLATPQVTGFNGLNCQRVR
jgi:filamentous hemagglutinin family protein